MEIIVQKFGGTSVATPESREKVLRIVEKNIQEGKHVVVVVSAMGREGSPYATDTLLSLIGHDTDRMDPKETDMLISTGEIISTVVLSYHLKCMGIKAHALTGGEAGIITDDQFMNAQVVQMNTGYVMELLEQGIVPIIAGFQGRNLKNMTTTLGRGGSDTTAALIGEAIGASAIEIYTDVDGIKTADPRVYAEAKTLDKISYEEVFQMADSGAKVIHKGAVEVAMRAGIPLVIKNTFSDHQGTVICHYKPFNETRTVKDQLITGIAHRVDRVQLHVEGTMHDEDFFQELAARGVSIDIINIFPNLRVFTIDKEKLPMAKEVLGHYPVTYDVISDCAKVTVVGERMTGVPGVMAKIVTALTKESIEILQTADSLSTIACLIKVQDIEKAVTALHKAFDL